MKLELKNKSNYCASIVKIENIISLEKCDNIQGTQIFGNHVIISKDVCVGDIGIYFPVETSIKDWFLSENNLFRDKLLNSNKDIAGFFEYNGRVRCMKLRGYKSEGFWIPISSLNINEAEIGLEFDYINGKLLCEKYVVKKSITQTQNKKDKKNKKLKRKSKIIDEQFRFHIDTPQFGKNIFKFELNDIISISEKLHGTSSIASYILCKKDNSIFEKILNKVKINIKTETYDYVYASRKVIKNSFICKNPEGFYSKDIWKTGFNELKDFLDKGMTVYFEIVGYLANGKMIQNKYDYGCELGGHKNYIYRITSTNEDGKVFEWSMLQVQQWCKEKGLNAVPIHYYGTVKDLMDKYNCKYADDKGNEFEGWRNTFLNLVTQLFLEKKCYICKHDVPNEGVVVRKEVLDIEPYKHKSFLFKQLESKEADEGIENIEDSQEVEE